MLKQKILNFNFEQFIINSWKRIPSLEKKVFLWIFIVSNLVFLFHSVTFFFANHEWIRLMDGAFPKLSEGRWAMGGPLIPFGRDFFPIFNNLYSFCGFSLAIIYLAKYWKVPKTVFSYSIFGLFIILMPYTLSWMWYVFMTSNFWFLFLIFYGLYQVQKEKILNHLLLITFVFIALGGFQSIISTVLIAFLGKCLLDITIENVSLKELIKKHYKVVIDILLACIMYFGVCLYLHHIGVMKSNDYHNQFVAMSDLKSQAVKALIAIRDEFWLASVYMPAWFKRILLIPVVIGGYLCVCRKNWKKGVISILLIIGILLCSQITAFLSGKHNFFRTTRIDFYSFPYIYALACVILLNQKQIFKNLILALMIFSVFYSILGDIRCQRVWYLTRESEIGMHREIVARIHILPNFNRDKKYKLVRIGDIAQQRYFDKYNNKNVLGRDWAFGRSTVGIGYNINSIFNTIEAREYVTRVIRTKRKEDILALDKNYILNRAKPWPHKDSVAIIKDTIYIIMDETALKKVKKRIRKLEEDKHPK